LLPLGVYTIPELSQVGSAESQLTEAGVAYEVGVARYRELARGVILGEQYGLLKLLVSAEDGRILGVHAFGAGATELVHIGQTAMGLDATIDLFVDTVFNYPTLAECYRVAALDGINRMPRPWAPRP
jgi:NAD(P) transhydrogenase